MRTDERNKDALWTKRGEKPTPCIQANDDSNGDYSNDNAKRQFIWHFNYFDQVHPIVQARAPSTTDKNC